MQINDMMLYDIKIPLLISILILVNITLIIKYKDKYKIKNKYLDLLDKIDTNQKSNDIYQQISYLIRLYISEEIKINIKAYTLEDIKQLNNNQLTKIIEKCYRAEFSKNYYPNINIIINETKELIKTWK